MMAMVSCTSSTGGTESRITVSTPFWYECKTLVWTVDNRCVRAVKMPLKPTGHGRTNRNR